MADCSTVSHHTLTLSTFSVSAQLVMLLILLGLLRLDSYVMSTWGAWLVALTLLVAPFWFNPQTFSMSKTTVRPQGLNP